MSDAAMPEPPQSVAAKMEIVEKPINTVLQTVIVGMINMCRGLPPEIVLTTIAWHTGNLLASSISGKLEMMVNARQAFLQAFADGVHQVELPPANKQ